MCTIVRILSLFVVAYLPFAVAAEAQSLFLCDDGRTVLLTDQASRGCPVFIPQAELIVVPDGSTWADVEWAVASRRPEAFQPKGVRRPFSRNVSRSWQATRKPAGSGGN